jgi:amino acid transporter
MEAPRVLRVTASLARILAAALGVLVLVVAVYGMAGELGTLRIVGLVAFSVPDAATFVGLLAALLSGGLLLASVLTRVRIPLRARGPADEPPRVYGFGTILAIGIGSTLGSPLFLLIPLNVLEYEIVSIVSLTLAAILSLAMAKNNSDSYRVLKTNGLSAVGGPAFVRVAVGVRSARYFISRFSMAVANAALAAYCVLVFVLFVFGYLPTLLQGYGLGGLPTFLIVGAIGGLFALWFVMNSILERRFIRAIGLAQVAFTSVLVAILVAQSYLLGSAGGWNFRGLLAFPAASGLDWVGAILVNTGYLYILFFGFQEIQALDREARDTSRIPVVSWLRRGYVMGKDRYFGIAMIATVVIAATVNIFYALAVYAANPSLAGLSTSQIPALYVTESVLGKPQVLLTALAFMLATFTTFVPAFLAATRHIGSLGEDGFLPRSVARMAWLFVLAPIVFLAAAGQDFLVSITDYMVLVSLGIIALSAIWLRRDRRKALDRNDSLALGVGLTCYVAAGALYVVTPSVAVFGSLSIAVAFLVYDLFELGSLGMRLFVAVVDVVSFVLLTAYPRSFPGRAFPVLPGLEAVAGGTEALRVVLILSAVVLVASFAIEVVARQVPRHSEDLPADDSG